MTSTQPKPPNVLIRHVIAISLSLGVFTILYHPTPTFSQEYVAHEILVKFKEGVSEERIAEINNLAGTKVRDKILFGKIYRLIITREATVEEAVRLYKTFPEVEFAEPTYTLRLRR